MVRKYKINNQAWTVCKETGSCGCKNLVNRITEIADSDSSVRIDGKGSAP